jgi:drug/metabolite transporter (DMT)-like permease
MMLGMASFVANDISTKIAVQHLPTPEIMAIRGSVAALIAITLVCIFHGAAKLKTILNKFVFRRSVFESLIGPMIITCYAFLPLATVTAVMQIGPFFAMIAGIYLFRESIGWRRWSAALVGFVGVMLIIKPGASSFQPAALFVVLIALMTIARDIQSRKIGNDAPPFVVSLATSVTGIVMAFVLTPIMQPFELKAWGPWLWPDLYSFLACCSAGIFLVIAHTFSFLAFRSGDMSVVAPFRYFYLFFAVICGILLFAEYPDWVSLAGMALIVAAGLYLLHRERMRARHAAAASTTVSGQ